MQGKNIERKKNHFGILEGDIVYSDLTQNEKIFFSKKFPLTGKPDYIIKTKHGIFIPVEVKTGWHTKPLQNHVMQLIAYCQLVEETMGNSVPFGVLYYCDTGLQFRIPFDESSRHELVRTIQHMCKSLTTSEVTINHKDPSRCSHCSVRTCCHYALV